MAPSKKVKKTKSSLNPGVAKLLIKALEKNQSVETQQPPPQPSGSISSPVSVKKQAISSNLQKQLTKKRKRVT